MSEDRALADAPEPEDELDDQPEDEIEPDEPAEGDQPDAEPAEPNEPLAEPARRPQGRGDQRIRQLANNNRELRERLARLEGQLQAPIHRPPPVDTEREEREFAERLRMLAPDEAAREVGNRIEQRTNQRLLQQEIRIGDQLDRQAFSQLQRDEPAARRLANEVERVLMEERNQGRNPARETIYTYLAGKEMRERAGKAGAQQRREGQRRIASQTTRPGNSRSTAAAPAQRRGQGDSEEAILERWGDTPLW